MTLEQLRIFVAVAEREHMTRAAENLGLTQSAVSGAIQALEARHNVSLFNRVGRRIELTQDGRFFLSEARAVLRAADAAAVSLLELRGLSRERIVQFHAAHPNIDIKLSIGNSDQVAAAVSSGSAEIGFVEGTIHEPNLVSEQVGLDELIIVVGAKHPWSRLRQISKSHITQAKWILRERGALAHARFSSRSLSVLAFRLNSLISHLSFRRTKRYEPPLKLALEPPRFRES